MYYGNIRVADVNSSMKLLKWRIKVLAFIQIMLTLGGIIFWCVQVISPNDCEFGKRTAANRTRTITDNEPEITGAAKIASCYKELFVSKTLMLFMSTSLLVGPILASLSDPHGPGNAGALKFLRIRRGYAFLNCSLCAACYILWLSTLTMGERVPRSLAMFLPTAAVFGFGSLQGIEYLMLRFTLVDEDAPTATRPRRSMVGAHEPHTVMIEIVEMEQRQ